MGDVMHQLRNGVDSEQALGELLEHELGACSLRSGRRFRSPSGNRRGVRSRSPPAARERDSVAPSPRGHRVDLVRRAEDISAICSEHAASPETDASTITRHRHLRQPPVALA